MYCYCLVERRTISILQGLGPCGREAVSVNICTLLAASQDTTAA